MTRLRLNLNRDWRFIRQDVDGAHTTDFDDSGWSRTGVPHSFDLPYFRTPEFYVGYGWYRKRLNIPGEWRGKRLFLAFDGVFQEAEIFLNGQRAGDHRGGYTGFCIDITDHVQPGDNVLSVRVNNHWNPRLAPRAGEHIFPGGIYRDAHLIVTDPLHVTWYGTSISTPQVSRESAIVEVKTEIRNDSASSRKFRIVHSILDAQGAAAATLQSVANLAPGEMREFSQRSDKIITPKLWHPDHPHLYSVRTRLIDDQGVADEVASPLGFRWFEWTSDRGFFLNGENYYLRGANAHQDHAGWGIAITQAACYRDVRLIKDCGMNFVRGAHYPHHPAFARACDELGVLFWSENCFWGKGGFGPEGYWNASAYPVNPQDFEGFEQSCKDALREMIRTHRNHPSIIAWSMTNEAFFTYNIEKARTLISDLVNLSRQLDPTRPAAVGGAQRGDVDRLGDIAGYNGDGAKLFIDPGVPNMVSEYGAISKPHTAYDPFFGDLQAEQFTWRSGQAIWCGFDYGSIAGRQGLKGIVDHSRLPKRSWHWYRNEYRQIPPPQFPSEGTAAKLRLESDKASILVDGVDDCQIIVTVLDNQDRAISNCPSVMLKVESGPGEFPTGTSITFDPATDIKIIEGQAAIAMRSYFGGTTAIRASSPGLPDARLNIECIGEPGFIEGVTARNSERPYTPPTESEAARIAMHNAVNVARDRPSRASSEAANHPARDANDADLSTAWVAGKSAVGEWWQVDLEGFYQISGTKIVFPREGNFRFVIDLSEDGMNWNRAVDRTETANTSAARNDIYPPGAVARYLRITFTALPSGVCAGLAEVDVFGVLAVR